MPATTFCMGADEAPHQEDGEGPSRYIQLDAYQLAATSVSTGEFANFVATTGYVTVAELNGGSNVFAGQLDKPDNYPMSDPTMPWWRWVEGAYWRQPWGPMAGDADDRLPVVHICWMDAMEYALWAKARLPTEAEWENAAQAQAPEPLIWQGEFPHNPSRPPFPVSVDSGEANELGFMHLCGNVWEWVADRFTPMHSPRQQKNPHGPLNGDKRVLKGGSYLCAPSYCARYRPSSRRGSLPDNTTSHQSFRLARDIPTS